MAALHEYQFSQVVRDVFHRERPHLADELADLAFCGLKEYFLIMLMEHQSGRTASLGMPSVLIDDAWHAFVLCTKEYEAFCWQFFGKMVHHCPDPAARPRRLKPSSQFKADVKNLWRAAEHSRKACPNYFTSVNSTPLIFGLDLYAGLLDEGWIWMAPALDALASQAKADAVVARSFRLSQFGTGAVATNSSRAGGTGSSCTSSSLFWSDSTDSSNHSFSNDSSHHRHSDSSDGSSCGSSCGDSCGGD